MKKLFKSHPRHPHHQHQQQQQQQQDEDREPGPRAISPFTLVHNANDPTSPDAQLQQYAQQQQALYQQHPVHARERDREPGRERERDNVGRGYRNSVAAYPSTDDITSWEIVAGQHPYRQRQQQQPPPLDNDRDRSPSVASLSTSNTTLPNPFSPQPHPSTPPYTHQQPFSASRTSSLNSLLPGAPQSSPRTTSAPLLAQNHPPNPPGSAGSYAPSPTSPAAGAGLPGSGGTTGPAGASTGAAGGVGGGVLRKKNANSNNIQSPIHTASLQLAQHQLPQASVPPPPQASTAAILRALDSSMLGAMSPTASSQHQHKTGSGLVSRTSIRSAHRDRDREPRENHHPQPQSQPQAHPQQLHALHSHLRVPVLSSRKEKSQQGTRQHQQRPQQYPQQQQYQESQHRNRSHSLSDIEFGANEGVNSDFDDESDLRRSSEVDPELERDSLELERQARWRERDLEIEGKAVPRKDGGEKEKDRDSKGFFERLQQLGDSGDSKREGGGVGKDERGTEKERKDKKEKAQFLTNIFSTGKDKDKDKDRSKSKKDFDTTVDPLTLPPSQHHPPHAPPRLDISAPVPLHANQPQPLPIHSYSNIPPSILPNHDLAYHSTPAINAPMMISSSQALSQSGGADPLARMVGLFVSPSQEGIDWALALELCEQTKGKERKDGKEGRDVKDGEANAKSIAKALRKELKYARLSEQLGAITLWAVMLQNASDFFITQTSSRKFLDVVEDVILHPRSSVIRDRLIEVLGAAAYLANQKGGKDTSKRENFKAVWRKLKPGMLPDEGMPLSMDNPMFHPQPVVSHPDGEGDRHRLRPPMSERRSSRNGIIPVDEDIRRLSQECTIGRGNAQLLDEALAFATPDDLKEKDIIKEFYAKCRASQDLIQAQIPWASAGAERSRMRQLETLETLGPEALQNGDELPSTQEEKLLADLLLANEELAEVLRIYGDIERIGIESEAERQARERSKVEIRATSKDHQLSGDASSFLAAPSLAPSSSRSQSPSSFLMNSQTFHPSNLPPPSSDKHTAADTMPLSAAALYHQHFAQLQSSSQQHLSGSDSSHSFNTHGHSHNQGHLAPAPNRPLHGPRSPPPSGAAAAAAVVAAAVAGAGVHSRTSSPINASRPNSIVHSRAASVDTSLGSSIDANTTAVAANPKIERETSDQTVLRSATVVQNDPGRPESTELPTLSEKAAGKRRMAEEDLRAGSIGTPNGDAHVHLEDLHSEFRSSEPDVNNTDLDLDPDNDSDRDRDRWKPKIHYAYDAAAERTKERMRELAVGGMG